MKRMTKIALFNKCVCFLLFLFIDVYQMSVEVRQSCARISQNFREMSEMRGCVVCSTASMTSNIALARYFHFSSNGMYFSYSISTLCSVQFQCFHFHICIFTPDTWQDENCMMFCVFRTTFATVFVLFDVSGRGTSSCTHGPQLTYTEHTDKTSNLDISN